MHAYEEQQLKYLTVTLIFWFYIITNKMKHHITENEKKWGQMLMQMPVGTLAKVNPGK